MAIHLKRVYDPPGDDGERWLIDRLWPRGVSKERAALDAWPKQLTPSHALRNAYHAGELDDGGFRVAYLDELEALADGEVPALPAELTLLTASRQPTEGHASILRDWLLDYATQKAADA